MAHAPIPGPSSSSVRSVSSPRYPSTVRPAARRVTFEIGLRRLPGVAPLAGMVSFTFRRAEGSARKTTLGSLTDAALRARIAHFDAHSANEIAALRRALAPTGGEFLLIESWKDRDSCLRHWYGFLGSRVQSVEWKCEACGDAGVERLGRSSGEAVYLKCARGHVVPLDATK